KRRISSFDTVTSSLLKCMPSFKSSNHSIAVIQNLLSQSHSSQRPKSKPYLHGQTACVQHGRSPGHAASSVARGNRHRAGAHHIAALGASAAPRLVQPMIDLAKPCAPQQPATERITLFRFLRRQRLAAVQPQEYQLGMNLAYLHRGMRADKG